MNICSVSGGRDSSSLMLMPHTQFSKPRGSEFPVEAGREALFFFTRQFVDVKIALRDKHRSLQTLMHAAYIK